MKQKERGKGDLKMLVLSKYICPCCKEPIYDDEALLCLYCGESLRRGVGFMGKIKYPNYKIIIIAVVIVVLLSFALLIIK